MGLRSLNFIVLKPKIELSDSIKRYINSDNAKITKEDHGTLIEYESNFSPMSVRDERGPHCVSDLMEEVAVHKFLGSLPVHSFYMVRAGDEFGKRGEWVDHGFVEHKSVREIQAKYDKEIARAD